jgi:FkbM family methyltransferase
MNLNFLARADASGHAAGQQEDMAMKVSNSLSWRRYEQSAGGITKRSAFRIPVKYYSASWWRVALRGRIQDAYSRLTYRPRVVSLEVDDERFRFFLGDPIGQRYYANFSSNQEWTFVRDRMIRPGMTAFDIGAHHGMTTILLSRRVGSAGHVVAFEALPSNAEIVRRNLDLNELSNTRLRVAAVGAQSGTVMMRNRSNSAILQNGSTRGIEVPVTTLDDYVADTGIVPNFLKIDVEGFEIAVLEGAAGILAHRPALMIEVHSEIVERYGHKPNDIWRLIPQDGYEVWIQEGDRDAPVPYIRDSPLRRRCHIFCLPLQTH